MGSIDLENVDLEDHSTPEEKAERGKKAVASAGRSIMLWHMVYTVGAYLIVFLYFQLKIQTIFCIIAAAAGILFGLVIRPKKLWFRRAYILYLLFSALPMIGVFIWAVVENGIMHLDDNVVTGVGSISWMLSLTCNIAFLSLKLALAGLIVVAFVKDKFVGFVTLFEDKDVEMYLRSAKKSAGK